jgi:hypothetical protein
LSEAVAKLASITFSRLSLLSWTINLSFLTEGKSCCYIHHTFLLGFPMSWSSTTHHTSAPLRVLSSTLESYTGKISILSFSLEY